jgi:GNAT superfamily N-acetyltransferase
LIRRATVDDAEAVSELVQRAYEHWVPVVGGRPRPMDDDYSEVLESEEFEGWVDAEGDVINGVIVLQPEADHLWVDNVAVDLAIKGSGVGRALLEFAIERARELNLPDVRFFTHERMAENRDIYARLGWAEYDEEKPLADFFVYFRRPVGDTDA